MSLRDYLKSNTLDDLANDLHIRIVRHPHLPLASLKYHQIDTPKFDPVARQCRGTVVNTDTNEIVAQGFSRFFNHYEGPPEREGFFDHPFRTFEKVDGSLVFAYNYEGRWRVNTSNGFAGDCPGRDGKTWVELVYEAMPWHAPVMRARYTYCFELQSPQNQVVQYVEKPRLTFLAAFEDGVEVEQEDFMAVMGPTEFEFADLDDALKWLKGHSEVNPLFEGFVMRNSKGDRLKIKSETYVIANHSAFSVSDKKLVKLVLSGVNLDEFLHVQNKFEERIKRIKKILNIYMAKTKILYKFNADKPDREAAENLKTFPLRGIIMHMRKTENPLAKLGPFFYNNPQTERLLTDLILEKLLDDFS